MRLVMHLARAAVIFWVAAVMLPAAVQQVTVVPPGAISATGPAGSAAPQQSALLGVASTAGAGRDRVTDLTARVHASEDDLRRLVARLRLETERFIAQIP